MRSCLPSAFLVALGLAVMASAGCSKKPRTPATTSAPPPRVMETTPGSTTDRPGTGVGSGAGSELGRVGDDDITGYTLEELNDLEPLADVHFQFDSAVLEEEGRSTLDRNAAWLQRHPTVTVLIEGHCDERGTVEYNLALGERRATAVYNYVMSLGIPAGRMKTISYGKEFPLDPGHDEAAWARNRRAHFEITGK